jgi:hypothetical protein
MKCLLVFCGSYPEQRNTGSRGYFGNALCVCESSQSRNCEPLADSILRA